MNLKSALNPLNILMVVSIFASILTLSLFVAHINKPIQPNTMELAEKVEIIENELKDRPTFEKVDLMMDERSQYNIVTDGYDGHDQPPIVEQPKPQPKSEITYKLKSSGKVVVAGDETCGADENRLHWELFAMPAPGCENTPHKGL